MAVKGRRSPRDTAQTAHTTDNSQGMGLEPGAHQCLGSVVVAHQLSCPAPCGILHSLTRNQTHIPCIGGQILNHWTTREVPLSESWPERLLGFDVRPEAWCISGHWGSCRDTRGRAQDLELADLTSSPCSASITSLSLNFLHCKMGFSHEQGGRY